MGRRLGIGLGPGLELGLGLRLGLGLALGLGRGLALGLGHRLGLRLELECGQPATDADTDTEQVPKDQSAENYDSVGIVAALVWTIAFLVQPDRV